MAERPIVRTFRGVDTMDGAGVRLRRMFGNREAELMDPFLLLDLFGSEDPDEYLPGFPWHPHRGIETVTYMLAGTVRHGDSMGNSGYIGPGDLQWMTAGSGIVHEEMPMPSPVGLRGFQLWVNLPSSQKMRDPAYRGFPSSDIPVLEIPGGEARVMAGRYGRARGPVEGLERDPLFFDLRLGIDGSAEVATPRGQTAFACVYAGTLSAPAGVDGGTDASPYCLVFGEGDSAVFKAGPAGCSLVFALGEPIRESIAWRGPIVMNTDAELDLAFREYANGNFVKTRAK